MTSPVGGEPTEYEPTELAGIADAQTESAHAWALEDLNDEPVRPRLTAGHITAAAVIACLVVVVAVASWGGYTVASRTNPPVATPTSSKAAAPPLQAPPLDGTYRVAHDYTGQTQNGTAMPLSLKTEPTYWAFRSACSPDACRATGIALDEANREMARTPRATSTLRFVEGQWKEANSRHQNDEQMCLSPDNGVGPGQQTESYSWSLKPQSPKAFSGVRTATVITNECGFHGAVIQVPVVFTRVGDAPRALNLPDPLLASSSAESVELRGGPDLSGVYKITFDNKHQTINGGPVTNALPDAVENWAFRSACDRTSCVATAAQLFEGNINQNTGIATALDFKDGQWREDTPSLQPAQPCRNGPESDVATLDWSVVEQSDGTLRGVVTGTVITDQCGHKGDVYKSPFTAIRTGDVPKTVVLADPALFLA